MKCVVIGANGFIGSHLVNYLLSKHCDVIALIPKNFTYHHLQQLNVQCVEFSLETIHTIVIQICSAADVVYNMVWVGMRPEERNDTEIQALNFIYNIRIVEFVKNHRIPKLIVPGSAAQYACGNRIIDGMGQAAPSDIYSATKMASYDFCNVLCHQYGIQLVWTLITSIYGPGRNDNNLISYTIKSLLKGIIPSYTNLEQEWDYLYIDDLLKALYLLAINSLNHQIYPIGSGTHMKMREYVTMIRDIINIKIPLKIGVLPYKNKILDNQVLDITALESDTGFKADYTFERGIINTIEYFRKNDGI